MLVRSLIEPCLASVCSVPGSGIRATSGGAPPETAASRTVSMLDPLLAYWTVTPDAVSKGDSAAVNAACSPLLHSAHRLTEPPTWPDDVDVEAVDDPHAASNEARTPTENTRPNLELFIKLPPYLVDRLFPSSLAQATFDSSPQLCRRQTVGNSANDF